MNFKKIIFWISLSFVVASGIIIPLEIYLQVREFNRQMAQMNYSNTFELTPYLQIRPKTSTDYHVNEDHFRGDPVDMSSDNFLVFALGGSTTFAEPLAYKDTYPALLQTKLRKHYYPNAKIQVQNAACDWYTTQHSLIRYLFKIRHYEPDLIIVMQGINDLFRSFAPEAWSRPGAAFEPSYSHYLGALVNVEKQERAELPLTHFLLWEKIKKRVFHVQQPPWDLNPKLVEFVEEIKNQSQAVPIREFKSHRIFEGNLRILVRLAKMHSSRVILVTQPNIYREGLSQEELESLYFGPVHMSENGKYPDLQSLIYGMRLFNDTVIKIGEEEGVPVVDLEKAVPKTGQFFFDDVHPREPAAAIEAELLFQKIKELGLVDEHQQHVHKRIYKSLQSGKL